MPVRFLHSGCQLDGNINGGIGWSRPPFYLSLQRFARVVAHGDEQLLILRLTDLVNSGDIRVIETGGRLGLMYKAIFRALVGTQGRRQELQGHRAIKRAVMCPVDHSHSTPADGC